MATCRRRWLKWASGEVGRLPSTEQLNLAIGLPLRNQELLGQMLQQIYDPATHGIISI